MAKSEKQIKATALRRKGLTLKEISVALGVSKGSASLWCREIILTSAQLRAIESRSLKKNAKGRLIGAQMNKQKRLDVIERFKRQGIEEVGSLSKKDLLLVGTALYWAEGAKTEPRFVFVNSSPDMIQVMYQFLTTVLGVSKEDIRIGVQINKIHLYRIQDVLKFWSKLLHLPTSQFDKPYYIKTEPKKVYENMETYYGTVRLKVRKSANLQYRISGLIGAIIEGSKNMSG